jgi:hypothetical protein
VRLSPFSALLLLSTEYFLMQEGFIDRDDIKAMIAVEAVDLACCIRSSTFKERYLDPFKAMNPLEREETILLALSGLARAAGKKETFEMERKLCPEITLEKLCADDGDGLAGLFSFLLQHILEPNLVTSPIPNPEFFKKVGFGVFAGVFPATRGRRAWIEDTILSRHSMLFDICNSILDTIVRLLLSFFMLYL